MIVFENIKFKNILSYGNTWTEFNFIDARATLLIGKNGCGKSVLIDALAYVLYGKPFRKIGLPQLANSINRKGMEVWINFSIGDNKYTIKRGKWPGIFEIWINDSMLPQSAALKDYQKILSDQILCMNYNTFTQIIILGSSSFTPFMNLTPPTRKSIIENLLNISVLSVMNQIVRERLNEFKDKLSAINHKIEILNNSYELQKEYIRRTMKSSEELLYDINKKIDNYQSIIYEDNLKINRINIDILKLENTDLTDNLKKQTRLNEYRIKISGKIKRLEAEKIFLTNNDECSKCSQIISTAHKEKTLNNIGDNIEELSQGLKQLEISLATISNLLAASQVNRDKFTELENQKNGVLVKIQGNKNFIELLEKDKENAQQPKEEVDVPELDQMEANLKELQQNLKSETLKGHILNAGIKVLKDDGVKTKVIKHYLPMINHYCNLYLRKLGFSISFEFDENFTEIIKARYRDTFSYGSFSEGEKTRINLALLFTWRSIAKLKNNASCNLLILDEVLDGSLDADGIADFIEIIGDAANSNVIIISHRDEAVSANFDKNIVVTMKSNFSQMKIMQ